MSKLAITQLGCCISLLTLGKKNTNVVLEVRRYRSGIKEEEKKSWFFN